MKEGILKMKKRKLLLAAIALLVVFAIGTTIAYLTDTTTTLTNTFTMGDVEITLTEPNWDPDDALGLVPGATVTKDPTITNTGTSDAYVFIKVVEPCVNGKKAFTYTLNSGWVAKDSPAPTCSGDTDLETVYAYGTSSAMTNLAATNPDTATPALFSNVTLNTALLATDLTNLSARTSIDMDVTGYAIQSENLSSAAPATVWTTLSSN